MSVIKGSRLCSWLAQASRFLAILIDILFEYDMYVEVERGEGESDRD